MEDNREKRQRISTMLIYCWNLIGTLSLSLSEKLTLIVLQTNCQRQLFSQYLSW